MEALSVRAISGFTVCSVFICSFPYANNANMSMLAVRYFISLYTGACSGVLLILLYENSRGDEDYNFSCAAIS